MLRDRSLRRNACGFSLIDMLATLAIFATMSAAAVPMLQKSFDNYRLGIAARNVERELQSARLKAVRANQPMRVRFNCPATGQYRRVEFMNAAIDSSTSRCAETSYPFPSPQDGDPATPGHDGALRYLRDDVHLTTGFQAIEFRPDGRAFQVTASGTPQTISSSGVQLTLYKGAHSVRVSVNGLGRVQID